MNTSSAAPGEGRGMLLIDDDTTFLSVLARAMTRQGFEVWSASSVAEGLLLAARHLPDCAVVDLSLPGESGMDAVSGLHRLRPDMRILMLTGYASIASTVEAIKLGAVNYLSKPADAAQIVSALFEEDGGATEDYPRIMSVHQVEWEHLQRVLREHGGNVSETARALNLHRRTLQRKLAKRPSPGRPDIPE